MGAAAEIADSAQLDPLEMLMRNDAVKTAVSRFVELRALQQLIAGRRLTPCTAFYLAPSVQLHP